MMEYLQGPYVFVLISLLVVCALFYIRYRLINMKKDNYIVIGNGQTIGKRDEQEDSFSTVENEKGIMAVLADGMGGYTNGKVSSSIAVNTFIEEFSNSYSIYPIEDFFRNVSRISNRAILDKSKGSRSGTTLVSVIVTDEMLYWASIGDSAIALFRNGEVMNLNKKHIFESELEQQYISGKISEEQMLNNPMKKRITSYLGAEVLKDIEICEKPIKLKRGDKVILCSDGVYNSITEIEMETIMAERIKPYEVAEEIIEMIKAKNFPKQDNATIVILEVCQ
ncbi:PP2C family protein-serine/threonine phosphatase [Pseudobacteroides cellulosolvens]|uniref:Protein serine/threonine phosphatase n=2 Tax=Pseudobacteroides cellulosolvens TaxID=35825 RepID=A0A0L6JY38_9FIRM|nr:protein phosphatase 2C domain-containing protein [Pseudobacteroides cellulosolvens]KNY30465.1 protein serine/threonine phosphatase [Pseudobacteroides cellulosolvens ATCC 35603 = DSM 2933]